MRQIDIGGRMVGADHVPVVIAEIGINHEGSLEIAKQIAQSAIDAGAEIIKHQTHIPDEEMSLEARNVVPGNTDVSIYEVISRCALSEDDEFELRNYVIEQGEVFISTPFSIAAVERIQRMELPAVKIGSGECANIPLLEVVSKLVSPLSSVLECNHSQLLRHQSH